MNKLKNYNKKKFHNQKKNKRVFHKIQQIANIVKKSKKRNNKKDFKKKNLKINL